MKLRKLFAGLLSVTVLLVATLTVFANPSDDKLVISEQEVISEKDEHVFEFGSFTATVVEINDYTPIDGAKMIALEDADEMPINMIVSEDTFVVNDAEITVGAKVTGYFDANAPMLMIYPPQYNPEVVVVENKDQQVKVDVFNKDLLSADNMLKLNISENTKVITQNGDVFKGELGDRKLVVIYDIATKSIPAQTTPIQVIVLDEDIKEPEKPEKPEKPEEDVEEDTLYDVENMDIIVKDQKINSPAAYIMKAEKGKGVVMVALRPIAEALGFEVTWEGKLESIYVGIAASLKIDQDEYTFAKMAPIKLGAAPALVEGMTYVPLDFFTDVLQLDTAEISGSNIIIK